MQSENTKGNRFTQNDLSTHIVVLGNEKGGSGKSTTAMHIAVYLQRQGFSVGCLDLDAQQGTFSRYIQNRIDYVKTKDLELMSPAYAVMERVKLKSRSESEVCEATMLDTLISELRSSHDFLIIDTPGSGNTLARRALAHADTLLTPMNDSFVDLDILGQVDPESHKVTKLSHYAEVIFEQRKVRASRRGPPIDWVVMRNRLGTLDNTNNRLMELALAELSRRIGFRVVHGLTERVVFRELYLKGLTLFDLRDIGEEIKLSMSHIAARQEVIHLVTALALDITRTSYESKMNTGRDGP